MTKSHKSWKPTAALALLGLPIALIFVWPILMTMIPRSTSKQCEAVQVLANDDELWCFIEISQIGYPANGSSSGFSMLGHTQWVVIVSASGERRRIAVPEPNGVTFHPNLSHIFRHEDQFCLFTNLYKTRRVYRWDNNQFVRLGPSDSEAILKQHSLDKRFPIEFDRVDLENGWKKLHKGLTFFGEEFHWRGKKMQLGHTRCNSIVTCQLSQLGERSWTLDLVSFDRTPQRLSKSIRDRFSRQEN